MLLRVVDWNIDTIDVVHKVMYEEFVMPAEEARAGVGAAAAAATAAGESRGAAAD